jgi:hypothetical protein
LSVEDAVRVTVEETAAFAAGMTQATEGGVMSGTSCLKVATRS